MKPYNGFPPEQRLRALEWARREYAEGRRHKPTVCDACGQDRGIFDRHSEDYSEPFGPHIGKFGLCFRCHMMVHLRWRYPQAWSVYRAEVAKGRRLPACYKRSFPQVQVECERMGAGLPLPWMRAVRPERLLLDEIDRGEHDPRPKDRRSAP